jgi:hypothetical protein
MEKAILFIFSMLYFCLTSSAQEATKATHLKSGIELGSAFCYSGLNINLDYTLSWKENNTISVGPKFTISDSYQFSRGPWGIHAGYRRLLSGQSKFRTFAALEYQVEFVKPYNPNNLDVNGLNEIHELHFSYGIQYRIWKNLIIGNSMGGGVYIERFFESITGDKKSYDGYNGQFRLFAHYSF